MCFHGNQHPWAIKHPFISLYSKYQSLKFICLPVVNSPAFPSLDDIYCTLSGESQRNLYFGHFLSLRQISFFLSDTSILAEVTQDQEFIHIAKFHTFQSSRFRVMKVQSLKKRQFLNKSFENYLYQKRTQILCLIFSTNF